MSTVIERIGDCGIVAVAVIEKAENAVPAAEAILAGGVSVIEVTFRTAAAADSIRRISAQCPDILVGAGTVVNLEQCKQAVECGAKFIVSPGYDEATVDWCLAHDIPVTPGCVTPSEIMAAMAKGLNVLKFFPANVYGGLSAMKALSGPFGGIRFIPTGGVNADNIGEYLSSPIIHAVGGSWLCSKKDISEGNFEKITALCREARSRALGYEVVHVGINTPNADTADEVTGAYSELFGFACKSGNSSNFSGTGIEVMKSPYLGQNGHIAVRTNSIRRAIADLESRGYRLNAESAKYKDGKMIAIYLENEVGGFAIHLLQK